MAGRMMPLDAPHKAVEEKFSPDELLDTGNAVSAASVLCGQDGVRRSWLLGGELSDAAIAALERPLPCPRRGWRRWRRRRGKRALWMAAQTVERGQRSQQTLLGWRAEQTRDTLCSSSLGWGG